MASDPLDPLYISCESCASPSAAKPRSGSEIEVSDIYYIQESIYTLYLEFVDRVIRERLTGQTRGAASMQTFATSNADCGPRPCVVTQNLDSTDNTVELYLLATFNNSPPSDIAEELQEFIIPVHSVRSPESVKSLPHLHTSPTWEGATNHQYLILLPITRKLIDPERWTPASGRKQKAGYFVGKEALSRLKALHRIRKEQWYQRNHTNIPAAQARFKAALLNFKEAHKKLPRKSSFVNSVNAEQSLGSSRTLAPPTKCKVYQQSFKSGRSLVSKRPTVPPILEARC